MVLHRPVEPAALTGEVGTSLHMSGYPTNQDLVVSSDDNFRVADHTPGTALLRPILGHQPREQGRSFPRWHYTHDAING
jgi:hypothetical protein